jgi:uncharacterized protein (DUF983 family)
MSDEGANRDRPVIGVVYINLSRVLREDIYSSCCPFCVQGKLSMDRGAKRMLMKTGRCNLCGQRVEYLDFDDLSFVKVENSMRAKGKLK